MDPDEQSAARRLERAGLTVQRFSKAQMRAGKSPDFRVLKEDEFRFYCEVKSSPKDRWLDQQIGVVSPGSVAGGARKDPIFNRLAADIHDAVKQFDAVNADRTHPNVLVLVNHDEQCGFNDLLAVLTGNFYAADGTVHPIYQRYSHGRIKDQKCRVDLYIWLDDYKPERFLFSQSNEIHHRSLCAIFGVNPDEIRQIDP
jgi:hypothetical protein